MCDEQHRTQSRGGIDHPRTPRFVFCHDLLFPDLHVRVDEPVTTIVLDGWEQDGLCPDRDSKTACCTGNDRADRSTGTIVRWRLVVLQLSDRGERLVLYVATTGNSIPNDTVQLILGAPQKIRNRLWSTLEHVRTVVTQARQGKHTMEPLKLPEPKQLQAMTQERTIFGTMPAPAPNNR